MGIIEGVKNTLIKDSEVEQLAAQRLETCNQCKEYSKGICSVCKCVLSFKTRSVGSKCPKGLWID